MKFAGHYIETPPEYIARRHAHHLERLIEAAQAVCDRWDSPHWKDLPHTSECIYELKKAIAEAKK